MRDAGIVNDETEVVLTTDHPAHEGARFGKRQIYMNDFMIALTPGADLFRRMLNRIGEHTEEQIARMADDPLHLTGSGLLTNLIEEAGGPGMLKVGVLPWRWVHPLPDMTVGFPEWENYDALIRNGEWFLNLEPPPFLARYWGHCYRRSHNMMKIYGQRLFQSDGLLAELRLNKFAELLGKRAETTGTAVAEFAQRFVDPDCESKADTVVELGVTRSFVAVDDPGCTSVDPKLWEPEVPEKWDWDAGAFTPVVAEVLQGLGVTYIGVDSNSEAIEISKTMLEGWHGDFYLHHQKASEFLKDWNGKPGSVGLIYMDHGDSSEKTAWMHADDAQRILKSGMLAPRGLVLIGDHGEGQDKNTAGPLGSQAGQRTFFPKSFYSRKIFEEAGFTVLAEGAQLLLEAPKNPPKHGPISKVIHQVWKTKEIGANLRREWIESWMEVNAKDGWEHRFWTDDDLEEFVAEEFPDFLDVYRGYHEHMKRVDAACYLLLKRLGGVYADLDFACLKPLDDLLSDVSLLMGYRTTLTEEGTAKPGSVCNTFMASAPGHPFWTGIEVDLERNCELEAVKATGPEFLTNRISEAARFLHVEALPRLVHRDALYPNEWDDPPRSKAAEMDLNELRKNYPNSYTIPFWTGTWRTADEDPKINRKNQKQWVEFEIRPKIPVESHGENSVPDRRYYFEFGGGLGDVFISMSWKPEYRYLNFLLPEEFVTIGIFSHNPSVREIFENHPKRAQFELVVAPYATPDKISPVRKGLGLPEVPTPSPTPRFDVPLTFYPTPADEGVLEDLKFRCGSRRFVLFSVSAGLPGRDIPVDIIDTLTAEVLKASLVPVFVGRTYDRHGRSEYHPPQGIDLIDCLSVSGVAWALQQSAGCICCHSATNILGWILRKPQLLLYPDEVYRRHIVKKDQWAFGIDFPECFHSNFKQTDRVSDALDSLVRFIQDAAAVEQSMNDHQKETTKKLPAHFRQRV